MAAKPRRPAATPLTPAAAQGQSRPRAWLAPCLAALVALPGLAAMTGGGVYVGNGTDLFSYQLPLRATVAALWAQSGVPLWNPYLLGGAPALAGLQLGVLYPPNLVALLLPPFAATELLFWLHLGWLAAGGAVLARVWRKDLSVWACAALGAWLALTGQTWGHVWAGHASFVAAWAWWPWVWAAGVRFMDDRRWVTGAAWGAALALQLLAGHPQVSFLCFSGLVATLALRAATTPIAPDKDAQSWLDRQLQVTALAVGCTIAAAVAAVLTLPQWLATWELAPALNRTLSTPTEIATAYSAPAATLWTALQPGPIGGAASAPGDVGYHETVAFVGPAMLVLAAIAGLRVRARSALLLAVGAACVVLSLGSHARLLPALADVVPGFGAFRVPARWLLIPTALLLLLGADAMAPGAANRWSWLRWASPALAALAVAHGFAFALPHLSARSRLAPDRVQWSAADRKVLRETVAATHRLAAAPALRMADWGGTAGVRVAGGYEPAITAGANRFGNALAGRSIDGYAVLFQTKKPGPWLDRMATSHLLLSAGDVTSSRLFSAWPVTATLPSGLQLRAHPAPRSRFEVAQAVAVEPDPTAAVRRLAEVPAGTVLLDRPLPQAAGATAQVKVITDVADEVTVQVRATGPVVAVLRDAWAPGWSPDIDGTPAAHAIADGMFRAVAVPQGEHQVTWRYQPRGWPWALWVALAGWLLVIASVWHQRRRSAA